MKITGVMVQYYITCKRELWFFTHKLNMNYDNDDISIGRLIHEIFYNKAKKGISIDNTIVLDIINKKNLEISEVKKSSRLIEPVKYQLYYYLYYLKKKGIFCKYANLLFPKERKTERVELTEEKEREIERILEEINKIINLEKPPQQEKKPYCGKCSYFELCRS